MRPHWEDVNARVRGLGSRLLGPDALESLARSADLEALARGLESLGVLTEEIAKPDATSLELALRRAAAREIRLVRRWLGPRDAFVAVALEAEDRRSLRALVRGAAAGVGAEARLAGLIPTPALPERLLRELASRSRVADQAALLLAAGHPYGAPLLAAASQEAEPDLFRLELAIAQAFAARALRGAGRAGGLLLEYVTTMVDLENCRSALLLVARGRDEPAAPVFIPGGRRPDLREFERAATAPNAAAAARLLGAALGGGTLAVLLQRHAEALGALETALDAEMLAWLRQRARLDPLGPAPLLLYLRRLRQQSEALSAVVWSVDLGMPAAARAARAARTAVP